MGAARLIDAAALRDLWPSVLGYDRESALVPLSTAQASAPSIPSLGHTAFNVASKAAVDSEDALHALASVEIPGFRNRLVRHPTENPELVSRLTGVLTL